MKAAATPTKIGAPRSAIPKPGAAGGPGSRLPTPGRGPTSARSPSYTNLKANRAAKEGAASTPGMKKERSFVQKDFQQTVAPGSTPAPASQAATPKQGTPPSAAASPAPSTPLNTSAVMPSTPGSAMSERLEEKVAAMQTQQELMQTKEQVGTLSLCTI